jgi:hypothetical protein
MKPFKETRLGKFLASKGLDFAMGIAGTAYPPIAAVNALKNLIMADSAPVKLTFDDQQEFIEAYHCYITELDMILKDVADARSMYEHKNEMADKIARWIMLWNLPLMLLGIAALVVAALLLDSVVLALVSASIGSLMATLGNERQQVTNFFLGSSVGSKEKGNAIQSKLTNDVVKN